MHRLDAIIKKEDGTMKKLAVVFAAMLILVGCGGGADETTKAAAETTGAAAAETTAAQAQTAEAFVFEANGVNVMMNAEAAPIVEALGEPKSFFESESCAFKGLDKEYTYNGFVLKTYPMDDVDYVSSVTLMDDTVETPEGICIGSSLDDVKAAYGDGGSDTTCQYEKGDSKLLIILDGGVVTSIQYLAITE